MSGGDQVGGAFSGGQKRMAKDVEQALADINSIEGALPVEAARSSIERMKRDGQYQADVY